MKILSLHSDYIKFRAIKKAINQPEEIKEIKDFIESRECLVVFIAVEVTDNENSSKNLVKNIEEIIEQVKTKNIVLYPYAHLSSNLAKPDLALKIMKDAEQLLKKDNYNVVRAPFGWYKEFEIHVKGHPLAELSREIKEEKEGAESKDVSEALKAEKKAQSYWKVIDEKGKLHDIKLEKDKVVGFKFSENLEKFAHYEMKKVRAAEKEPAHIRYMKKLELVDHEPGSDPGNLRYYPKGRMIKALIEEYVIKEMQKYGALEVETPIMYDFEHPSLKNYLHRFPARQYKVETPNKNAFLRFAACFGQFLMAHDAQLSYKDFPIKLFELTRYSFRVEQRGELSGLRRLRAFTMPDCHCFCLDLEQAKKEFLIRFKLAMKMLKEIGVDLSKLELAVRFTKEFYDKNKDLIEEMMKLWKKPALVEMWDDRFFYFILKYEFNFVDELNKATALNTDQIDVENAERYDISYIDEKSQKKRPLILHLSPTGAIERVMFSLLEQARFEELKNKKPSLPLWLEPIQVRVAPVSSKHLKQAERIARELEANNIRVDLDDRNLHVQKKIFESEKEWVPYLIVIGENEMKSKDLPVRVRQTGKIEKFSVKRFIEKIKSETNNMPFRPLPVNFYLSKRVRFV
ncbi:threonine--tRNA ligase [Candidatus Pacearchaeota archaeon CG1_02_31_27]|nr:MAG: threonine--tRNA ligase [Candidatus Pacearchaeota archaeon CG1_02_31_27]PIN91864.1 MAG: threonine--tRNA ligase [Candidatus Pacearchaeota archaeon CG10_big_fil_rev_8_21_14_0_10_31_59]PIZ80509.1 MAG: threonine--tRNA ligase [Candidatus Pacearchaeota archaeon CG_4_10_14_0_2_um_filter_31_10]